MKNAAKLFIYFKYLKSHFAHFYECPQGKITIALTGFSSIYGLAKCQHPEDNSPSSCLMARWPCQCEEKLTRTRSKDFAV